jgi:hypothetical protein
LAVISPQSASALQAVNFVQSIGVVPDTLFDVAISKLGQEPAFTTGGAAQTR